MALWRTFLISDLWKQILYCVTAEWADVGIWCSQMVNSWESSDESDKFSSEKVIFFFFLHNLCLALSVVSNEAIQNVLFGLSSIHNGNFAVISWQRSVNDLQLSPLRAEFRRINRLCFLNTKTQSQFWHLKIWEYFHSTIVCYHKHCIVNDWVCANCSVLLK